MTCPTCHSNNTHRKKLLGASMSEGGYPFVDIVTVSQCDRCRTEFYQRFQCTVIDNDTVENHLTDIGEETDAICPHCGNRLHKNNLYLYDMEEGLCSYPYVCPECDENFYEIEVKEYDRQEH